MNFKKEAGIGSEMVFVIAVIVSFTPILSAKALFLAIPIFLFILYVILNWRTISSHNNSLLVSNTLLFLLFIVLYRVAGYSDANIGRYLLKFLFFLPILGMLTFCKFQNERTKRLWWIILIVSIANISYNIFLGIKYPSINTHEVQNMMEESVLDSLNIGRSPFYTSCLFFANVSFFVFLNCKKKLEKIVMLISFLIAAVYICWFCFKASVVVIFLLSTILLYLAKKTKKSTRFIVISGVVSTFILVIMSTFSNEIIQGIITISPNERLTGRLVALIDSQNSEAYEGTLQGRESLVMLSVETWLSGPLNFLCGIGDHYVPGSDPTKTGIGQHAELIDTLAQYGIIGFVFLIVVYRKTLHYIISLFRPELKTQIVVIFLMLVFCGLSKHIYLPGIACSLFMLLPLSSHILKK